MIEVQSEVLVVVILEMIIVVLGDEVVRGGVCVHVGRHSPQDTQVKQRV